MIVTLEQYWMGRDKQYPDDLTDDIIENAKDLLIRVNSLLQLAAADGVVPGEVRPGDCVASGWRPPTVNAKTPNAAPNSKHMTGRGIDIRDTPERRLAQWCLNHRTTMAELGLWGERPQWTATWVHLQNIAPGRPPIPTAPRFFIPSSAHPLVAALPGELLTA